HPGEDRDHQDQGQIKGHPKDQNQDQGQIKGHPGEDQDQIKSQGQIPDGSQGHIRGGQDHQGQDQSQVRDEGQGHIEKAQNHQDQGQLKGQSQVLDEDQGHIEGQNHQNHIEKGQGQIKNLKTGKNQDNPDTNPQGLDQHLGGQGHTESQGHKAEKKIRGNTIHLMTQKVIILKTGTIKDTVIHVKCQNL
ncbi:MAG: hypothetical protein JAY74_03615, partial [Candidatus Thiodiazotropha taylori]|nr:hypothetical protein [Candidatus Thiodiazotropha taylori]